MRQRLAAILAADVAGYSRLMAADEQGTVAALDAARSVFRSCVQAHQGRVIDVAGDSVLAVFETAAGAVSAALAVQRQLATLAHDVPEPRRMRFRIGIHLGDVIEKADGTVYGDGVNIAARLEELAEPGGVTVSSAVHGAVLNRVSASFDDLGEQKVKNIAQPVRVFKVRFERGSAGAASASTLRFGRFEVRPVQRQLLVDGQPTALGERPFAVLLALLGHRDRVLSKQQLLELVSGGPVVVENGLQAQVSALRKLLGPESIATIPGRGYRFTATLDNETERVAPARPTPAPSDAAIASRASNLPAVLPPLVGRAADLATVRALVCEHRLVTVAGAGGIGKTRLAEAVAHSLRGAFDNGVWMVELAGLADAALVPAAVAQALRITLPGQAAALDELLGRIHSESLLLVIDNCEHLVDAASRLVASLLRNAPGVYILATSQQPLKLGTEQVVRLDTLAVPDSATLAEAAEHGAVALFVERVAAVQAGFALGEHNVAAVVDICRRLDGVALAIELAAARVPLLGVLGVRDHLGERFRVLTGGSRVAMRRHQTLRAALDWSHALLDPDEQTVFRCLGVFAGGFSLELAQQVASDERIDAWAVLDHLGTLVDKSMVVAEAGDVPRYHLLETTRAYALERLKEAGEEAALRSRHARCIQTEIHRRLRTLSRDECVRACMPELDNLRAAVEWASAADRETALALDLVNDAAVLTYQVGVYPECVRWMLALQPRVDESTAPLVATRFRFGLGLVSLHGGLTAERRQALLTAAKVGFARLDKPQELAFTLLLLVYVACVRNDFTTAQAWLDEARPLCGEDAPLSLRASYLYTQGYLCRHTGRREDALRSLTEALPLAQAAGDSRIWFDVLNNLGAVHFEMGHVDEAVMHHRALLELGRRLGFDSEMMALTLGWLSHFLTAHGALDEARAMAREALPHIRRTIGVRHFCDNFAALAASEGRLADAARLLGAKDAGRASRGEDRSLVELRTPDTTLARIAATHSDAQIAAWRAEGALLDEDAIVALVLDAPRLAR